MLETLSMGLADFHRVASKEDAFGGVHPDLRPRALMRTDVGHWVVSGFARPEAETQPADVMDAATELMGSTENFSAPELIFGARKTAPTAVDTWSIGAVLFAMLRMRLFLVRGTELPSTGTESHHFRTHRAHLVHDLYMRKPRLFRGRELDARQFLYPKRLPDQDRRSLREALVGIVGQGQEAREAELHEAVGTLLDRALSIDPKKRFTDALELARGLGNIAAMSNPSIGEHAATEVATTASLVPPSPGVDDETRVIDYDQAPAIHQIAGPPPASPEPTSGAEGSESTVTENTSSPFDRAGQTLLDSDMLTADTVREAALREPSDGSSPMSDGGDHPTLPDPRFAAQERELARALARLKRLEARVELMRRDLAEAEPPKASGKGGLGAALVALIALGVGTLALGGTAWHWVAGYGGAPGHETASDQTMDDSSGATTLVETATEEGGGPEEGTAAAPEGTDSEGEAEVAPEVATGVEMEDVASASASADAEENETRSGPTSSGGAATPSAGSQPSTPAVVVSATTEDPSDPATQGRVSIVGAEGHLVGPGGRVALGAVDPGTYEVFTQEGEAEAVSLGTISVAAGDEVEFRCGFGTCKRTR